MQKKRYLRGKHCLSYIAAFGSLLICMQPGAFATEAGIKPIRGAANHPQSPADHEFRLYILYPDSLFAGAEDASEMKEVEKSDLSKALFVVDCSDIVKYVWRDKSIVLTEPATKGLDQARHNLIKSRLEYCQRMRAPQESIAHAKHDLARTRYDWPQFALEKYRFVVTVGNRIVYGGLFIETTSQLVAPFPVMRVAIDKRCARLNVLPMHLPFMAKDPIDGDNKTAVAKQTKSESQMWVTPLDSGPPPEMLEMFRQQASSAEARKMRTLITDPQIRASLEKANRLVP